MTQTAETPIEAAAEVPAAAVPVADAREAAPVTEVLAMAVTEPKVRKPRKPAAAKLPGAKSAVAAAKAPRPAKIKIAARKAADPKTKTAAKAAKTATSRLPNFAQFKEKIMATKTPDFTAAITSAVAEAQEKAKVAFEKSTATVGEVSEFTKGNLEAIVASGKILATGLKEMGEMLVTEGKSAVETVTADVKELATLKSPADLFKLQGEIMRRNFDAMVAFGSKQTEAMMKLAGDAAAPVSNRVSIAVDKVKKAA
jgi:hypothetical protein